MEDSGPKDDTNDPFGTKRTLSPLGARARHVVAHREGSHGGAGAEPKPDTHFSCQRKGAYPLWFRIDCCGRAYLGEAEAANLLKLHRFSSKISYLAYPEFDTDPHPAL